MPAIQKFGISIIKYKTSRLCIVLDWSKYSKYAQNAIFSNVTSPPERLLWTIVGPCGNSLSISWIAQNKNNLFPPVWRKKSLKPKGSTAGTWCGGSAAEGRGTGGTTRGGKWGPACPGRPSWYLSSESSCPVKKMFSAQKMQRIYALYAVYAKYGNQCDMQNMTDMLMICKRDMLPPPPTLI